MSSSEIGAIFDWDGVIIDSSAAHEQSWDLLAVEEKRVLPPGHFKAGFGRKNQFIIPQILKWADDPAEIARLGARKEELYREILKTTGISALPGVRELLEGLRAVGVPCVVGSSTPRVNIDHVMTLAKLHGLFADIVSAEDVSHGKPDPEVFLKAAAKINRVPAKCVVFEDAFVGLEAARAGGFKCIGVGTTNSVGSLQGRCDLAVFRLDKISAADVAALVVPRNPCPCCGYLMFNEPPGSFAICDICYWEDDIVQLAFPDWEGGANTPSLIQAQGNYCKFGVYDLKMLSRVRSANNGDLRDPSWRPIDKTKDRYLHVSKSEDRDLWQTTKGIDGICLYYWRKEYWLCSLKN